MPGRVHAVGSLAGYTFDRILEHSERNLTDKAVDEVQYLISCCFLCFTIGTYYLQLPVRLVDKCIRVNDYKLLRNIMYKCIHFMPELTANVISRF